jgi:hypothetical protein
VRQFVVSEAPVSRVAQHVRDTVEDGGGIVAHHTSRKTEFDHLDVSDQSWRRAGYVGTYQRFREKPVQVRVRVWAQWPRRLLSGSVYLGFAVALVFFLASLVEIAIPPNAWIFTSLPILALIAIAFLMYTSSMADSETVERRIENRLVERLNDDPEIGGEIYDLDEWEAYRDTIVEEAREDARQRAPHGGSRVRRALADVGAWVPSFGSADDPPAETEAARADDPDEEDEGGGLASLKASLGLGSAEDGDDAEPDEDEEADEDEEGPGLLASVKDTLGLGSEDGEAATGEDETPVEETAEAGDRPDAASS